MNTLERSIVEGCKKGNRKSQKKLYELYLPYIRSLGRRYLFDQSYLNDMVQDIYIKIFVRIKDSYQFSKGDLKPWIAKLAIHAIYDFNKKNKSNQTSEINEEVIQLRRPTEILYKLQKEDLFKLIELMPTSLSEVFNMYVVDNLSHVEIAELLKCSPVVSRKRLSRARRWLKEYFSMEEVPRKMNDS